MLPGISHAGPGAYLVDDASITAAGECQIQSWLQALSGGQQVLNTLPACSTGPVEWSVGLAGQSSPYQHQARQLALIVEHIQPVNGLTMTQAGVRWAFNKSDSFDVIAGRSDASAHDHWLTPGLNFPLR